MRGKDSVKKQQYVCFALGLTKCFPENYTIILLATLSQHHLMLFSNNIRCALLPFVLYLQFIIVLLCTWHHFEERSIPNQEENFRINSKVRRNCFW